MMALLPYGRQSIDDDDIAAVTEVLRSDFLTTGPTVAAFETAFSKITQARHSIAVSNGTTALHLGAIALDLGPGDAVIVPTLTFLATANAARYVGAEVVFADVNPNTGLMNAIHLEDALKRCGTLKPRAVFPVHLAGQCADMTAIAPLARKHNLKIMADSCHALGGFYKSTSGKMTPVGSCIDEDISIFSFHPVKTIAMGEGGAITTNDDAMAERMMRLRTHGMLNRPEKPSIPSQGLDSSGQPNPWYYEMPELGYNYRASDIHCALGLSQLKKLDQFIRRRAELTALYDRLLAPLAPIVQPPSRVDNCTPGWHLYAARIDFKVINIDRAVFMKKLRDKDIGSQVHYLPVHRQPYYRDRYGAINLPGADHYYDRTLSLPLYPDLRDEDVHHVVNTIRGIVHG